MSGDSLDIFDDMIVAGSNRNKDCLQLFSLTKHQLIQSIDWEITAKKDPEAGFVLGTRFSRPRPNVIFAGGAGKNELKIFENNIDGSGTMRMLASINEIDSPILSMDAAKNGDGIALGLHDGRIILMSYKFEEPYGDFEGYQGGFALDKVNETMKARELEQVQTAAVHTHHGHHLHIQPTHGHAMGGQSPGFAHGAQSPGLPHGAPVTSLQIAAATASTGEHPQAEKHEEEKKQQ